MLGARPMTSPPAGGPGLLFAYGTLMRGYPLHRVLAPGATFVVGNSYLVKADIEKSGAAHDH